MWDAEAPVQPTEWVRAQLTTGLDRVRQPKGCHPEDQSTVWVSRKSARIASSHHSVALVNVHVACRQTFWRRLDAVRIDTKQIAAAGAEMGRRKLE